MTTLARVTDATVLPQAMLFRPSLHYVHISMHFCRYIILRVSQDQLTYWVVTTVISDASI